MVAYLPNRVFYLVRHAESKNNAEGSTDGDPDLTEEGIRQAQHLKNGIPSLVPAPTKYFVGIPKRVQRTASLSTSGKECSLVSEFQERTLPENISTMSVEKLHALSEDETKVLGIQSREDHQKQILSALDRELIACPDDEIPMFFVTQGIIKRIAAALEMKEPDNIGNTHIYRFDPPLAQDKSWTITEITQHLSTSIHERIAGKNPKDILPSAGAKINGAIPSH